MNFSSVSGTCISFRELSASLLVDFWAPVGVGDELGASRCLNLLQNYSSITEPIIDVFFSLFRSITNQWKTQLLAVQATFFVLFSFKLNVRERDRSCFESVSPLSSFSWVWDKRRGLKYSAIHTVSEGKNSDKKAPLNSIQISSQIKAGSTSGENSDRKNILKMKKTMIKSDDQSVYTLWATNLNPAVPGTNTVLGSTADRHMRTALTVDGVTLLWASLANSSSDNFWSCKVAWKRYNKHERRFKQVSQFCAKRYFNLYSKSVWPVQSNFLTVKTADQSYMKNL